MNSYIRIVATVFSRDMVCVRNISVDTLHKGDNEDNNNNNDNNKVNAETNDMSTMNSNTRIAATQCSLGTWFVSGI